MSICRGRITLITLQKKISSGLAGLKQVRPFVPTEVLISIFKALILPYFDYCDIVWAGLKTRACLKESINYTIEQLGSSLRATGRLDLQTF